MGEGENQGVLPQDRGVSPENDIKENRTARITRQLMGIMRPDYGRDISF